MPLRAVFLDTNGWLALLNSSDALHPMASTRWAELVKEGRSFYLTDWIVAETGNGLARTRARDRFGDAVDLIRGSSRTRLVPVSEALLNKALELYKERNDKTWGLVDCATFVVMSEQGILEAFTNDRHFEQAGFKCLLPIL
jgi:predicted nucleic acid-binding protein